MRGDFSSVQALHNKEKKYEYLDADFSRILNNHIDLSLEEPVKLTKPEKVRIIYNSEDDKSHVLVGKIMLYKIIILPTST